MEIKITRDQKTHWPSILILIVLAIGIVFFLGISFVMSLISVVQLFDDSGTAADNMIVAFSAGSEFILLLICAWFVFQKTSGNESAERPGNFPFASWQLLVIPLIVLVSISFGGVITYAANKYLSWFFLPLATLIVILPPIFLYVGLGSNGIGIGPRWRTWGTIGLGLTISPALMIALELFILIFALLVVAVFLSFQPGKLQEYQFFFQQLNRQTDQDAALEMVAPYLSDPRVIAAIFGYIALIVPLIEEMLKPLAVWLFARSIAKPSQGFVLGMLSGGAFAVIESLNASADGSESWPVVVGVRAGTSLLHIVLTGLMGHAIVGAFQEKRIGRLFATYFSVVAIHGIWNACAIAAGLSANGEALGRPEWMAAFLPASLCGLGVLGIGIFTVLIASNRKIHTLAKATPVPVSLPVEDKE